MMRPAIIKIGAMVILVVLYTSFSLNTFGSELFPPAIRKKPRTITIAPMSIQSKFCFPNSVFLFVSMLSFLIKVIKFHFQVLDYASVCADECDTDAN